MQSSMKKIFTFCLVLFSLTTFSQTKDPIKWTASYKSISATEGEIIIVASIDKTWHTYSQKATPDGPVPTSFNFTTSKQYLLVGKTEESAPREEFDNAFGAKTSTFSDKAEFKQKVKLLSKGPQTISFKVEYMCCDDKMCLPPKTIDLSVKTQ